MPSEVPLCAAATALFLCFACGESAPSSSAGGGLPGIGSGGFSAQGGNSSLGLGGAPHENGGSGSEFGGSTSTSSGCCTDFASPTQAGQFTFLGLSELSGLVASRAHPGVLYAQSDSGGPLFYAMSVQGTLLGTFTLSDVKAIDWEDISVGPGPGSGSSRRALQTAEPKLRVAPRPLAEPKRQVVPVRQNHLRCGPRVSGFDNDWTLAGQ